MYTPTKLQRFQIWFANLGDALNPEMSKTQYSLKVRPVLIISNNRQSSNPNFDLITIIPLTSNMDHLKYRENVLIEMSQTTSRLPFKRFHYGVVNMHQMRVLQKSALTEYVGRVKSSEKIELLNRNIKRYLALR